MGTWNSRGLRGSTLEDMVNRTNEWYLEKKNADIREDIMTKTNHAGTYG